MSGKVSGQVWDLDMRALIERARNKGTLPQDVNVEPQPLRTVLLALADHADHNGRRVYPGVELLAWKTELSERRVRALLSILRKLGILIPVRYLVGGRGHATEYRLDFHRAPHKSPLPDKHDAGDMVSVNPDDDDMVSGESLTPGEESLPDSAQSMKPGAERVLFGRVKDDATGPPTGLTVRKEPSLEPSMEPSRERARDGHFETERRRRCEECDDALASDHPTGLRVCFPCAKGSRARASPTARSPA